MYKTRMHVFNCGAEKVTQTACQRVQAPCVRVQFVSAAAAADASIANQDGRKKFSPKSEPIKLGRSPYVA